MVSELLRYEIISLASWTVGVGSAYLMWYCWIHQWRPLNPWLNGLRFTVWGAAPGGFLFGKSLAKIIFHGMAGLFYHPPQPLGTVLMGVFGLWLIASVVLFPLGVVIGFRQKGKAVIEEAPSP